MFLIYSLPVLAALLGVEGNVVDVPVNTVRVWKEETPDDALFAINMCETTPCHLEQFICRKNFLLPANRIFPAEITFQLNYQIEYMGDTITDVADFPFTLVKNYYSFTLRSSKGSSVRFSASDICMKKDGSYFDPYCHYHCEARSWESKTHKEIIEVNRQEEVCATPSVNDKSCSIPKFGIFTNTCPHCIPSKGCMHGSCLVQDGVVYSGTCDCEPGYYGHKCDENSICRLASPCKKGKCRPNKSGNVACECEAGFTGRYCEKSSTGPKYCRKNSDCKNGGVCIQRTKENNYCQCPTGFVGNFCEVEYQCPYNKS